MFRGIQQSTSPSELFQIGQDFLRQGDGIIALLIFDLVFDVPVSNFYDPGTSSFAEVTTFLEHFETYVRLLASFVSRDLPLANHLWRRVFSINELPGHHYSVQEGSFLFKKFTSNRFTSAELNSWCKEQLSARFRHRVFSERDFCLVSRIFALPCLYFAVDGHCYKSCADTPLSKSMPTAADYNMKINLYLQQIRILNSMYSALPQRQGWYIRYCFYLPSSSMVTNRSRM